MENKNKFAKVTKSYQRKLSLVHLTSEYENISVGSWVQAVIKYDNKEDFEKQSDGLFVQIFEETERDIKIALDKLAEKFSKDKQANPSDTKALTQNDSDNDRFVKSLIGEIGGFDKIEAPKSDIDKYTIDLDDEIDFDEN
ncbi:MAG: hypothetical protein Q7R95_02030 [bacterium]|nr:hypothetical protein [bacterium]